MQRSDPKLWSSIVKRVKISNKGGLPGQWSARKAQYAVKMYKNKGGRYKGHKNNNNSLVKWTRQKWRTRSGKPSVMGPQATGERYLPDKVIKKIDKHDKNAYNRSSHYKRMSIKRKKQYSKQPKKIRRILSKFLKK